MTPEEQQQAQQTAHFRAINTEVSGPKNGWHEIAAKADVLAGSTTPGTTLAARIVNAVMFGQLL